MLATTAFAQVVIIVVGGLILVLVPFIVKAFRSLFKDVHDLKVAVTGDPVYGVTGLVATVSKLVESSSLTQAGTTALLKDSKPDSGSTSRHVLDRIEAATKPEGT